MVTRLRGLFLLAAAGSAFGAAAPTITPSWDAFWNSAHVTPAPPRDFLEGKPYRGKFLNLTAGRLSDEAVKQWILADLRRGRGDGYATYNLRRDIADAGIFGPTGLNGTSDTIDSELSKGTLRINYEGYAETVAAAVIYLSKEDLAAHQVGYTDYVIVLVRRMTGLQRTRVLKNGAQEPFGKRREAGELTWQLDTGHFFNHSVLGPLWYQETGWSCTPNDGTANGEICGRVPAPGAAGN